MSVTWDGFDGPRHEDELMAAHQGQPPVAEQARTHGAGIPAADNGMDEAAKYGSAPSAC